MPAFGENLRREREMRGVSLEEISSATKISMRFLDAIEREDFSKLPGGIFSRSFIRTYAHYLGLDEEQVVNEYQIAARPQADLDLHRMVSESSSSGRQGIRTPVIGTLVALVLLVGGYALFRYSPRTAEVHVSPQPAVVETPKPATPPPATSPMAPGGSTGVPGSNPSTGAPAAGAPSSTPPAVPGASPSNPQAAPAAGAVPSAQSSLPQRKSQRRESLCGG